MQNITENLNGIMWLCMAILLFASVVKWVAVSKQNGKLLEEKESLKDSLRIALNKLEVKDVEIARLHRFKNMIPDPKTPDLIISPVHIPKFRFSMSFDYHQGLPDERLIERSTYEFAAMISNIYKNEVSVRHDAEFGRQVIDFEYIFKILPNV